MDRAPVEGDDGEASEATEPATPPENGSRKGLASRLSKAGPVVGVKEAYQRAVNKVTPSATAVVVEDDEDGSRPRRYLLPANGGVEAELGVEPDLEPDPELDFDEGPPEQAEEELEAEAAGIAPVVAMPDPEDVDEHGEPPAPGEPESETTTVVVTAVEEEAPVRVVTARRVRRVVRRIDPLSVLKLSAVFYVCLFVIFLIAGLLLWSMAVGSGSIDNIESFIVDVGFEDFEFNGDGMFRGFLLFGGALVVIGTLVTALLAILFNLISDLVGGIRYTVIEADPSQSAEQAVDSTSPGL